LAIEQRPEASNVPPAHAAFPADGATPAVPELPPMQDVDPGHGQQLGPAFREPRSDQLDIRRQLNTIRKHLVWVLLMSALSGVAAAFIGMSGTLPWRAETVLVVRRDSFARVNEKLHSFVSEDMLRANIRGVMKKEGEDNKEFAKLMNICKLNVRPQGMSRLQIIVEGPDMESVKQLAEKVEPLFNKKFGNLVADVTAGMQVQKKQFEEELVRIARDLRKLGRDRRRVEAISSEYEREKLKRETLQEKKEALDKELGPRAKPGEKGISVRVALSATDLKRRRLIEQIVALEMQQADFSNRYTASHPQVRSSIARLERLRKELTSLAPPRSEVVASGGREIDHRKILRVAILESEVRERVLKRYLDRAAREVSPADSEVQMQIRNNLLQSEIMARNQRISRLESVGAVMPLVAQTPSAKPIPPRAFWDRLLRSVPFGLLLGAVMGILFAMGMEHLRDSCSSPSEIHQDLGLSTLAIVPKLSEAGAICISPNDPHSDLAEMFSILRNNLRYSAANSPEKMVMVTSSLSGDGKSMIAMNLAVSFSFEGLNVLLIDADMRRSRGYPALMGGAKGPGLVPWLEGQIDSPQEAISPSLVPGLSVLSAGGKATNATKLVASPRMEYLLGWAQEHYDVVVVDTPAVLPVADTTMFASLARAVLMVIDSNTRTGAARAAISRLVHTRGKVVGAILNRADHRALGYMSYYGAKYGYGYGYGYRYGYKSYT
jgi:capsular exopolysaccharide synthesis family protein